MLKKFFEKNHKFLIIGIILLAIFYIFSFFMVKGGGLKNFDFVMTVRIQDHVPRRVDPFFSVLSLLGSFEVTIVLLIAVILWRRKIGFVIATGIFCMMHIVEIAGKAFLDHPPTPFMFHRYDLGFLFPSSYVQPGGSYPSGHAMRAIFLAIFFSFLIFKTKRLPKNVKPFIYAALIIAYFTMCLSRISLGEHWTSDVIGGSFLGAAFGILSLIFV